jgi:hypothetical protein
MNTAFMAMKTKKNKKPIKRTNRVQKRKTNSPERILQQTLVEILNEEIKGDVEWTCFPAGGGGAVRGTFLKKMGLKRGWPDLIFLRNGQFYGLELKAEKGKLSEAQVGTQSRLGLCGGLIATAWSIEESIHIIDGWGLLKTRKAKTNVLCSLGA